MRSFLLVALVGGLAIAEATVPAAQQPAPQTPVFREAARIVPVIAAQEGQLDLVAEDLRDQFAV